MGGVWENFPGSIYEGADAEVILIQVAGKPFDGLLLPFSKFNTWFAPYRIALVRFTALLGARL